MRAALTFALQDFAGAMVIVSHDRHLLRSVCDDFYLVDKQSVDGFSGSIEDYEKWMLSKPEPSDKSQNQPTTTAEQKKTDKREAAQLRQKLAPLNKQLKTLEKKIEELQKTNNTLDMQLADTSLYSEENKANLQQLLKQKSDTENQIEETELTWLTVQEQIEMIENEAG